MMRPGLLKYFAVVVLALIFLSHLAGAWPIAGPGSGSGSVNLSSPGPIGNETPDAGIFTSVTTTGSNPEVIAPCNASPSDAGGFCVGSDGLIQIWMPSSVRYVPLGRAIFSGMTAVRTYTFPDFDTTFTNNVSVGLLISSSTSTKDSSKLPWDFTITEGEIRCSATGTVSVAIYSSPTNTSTYTLLSASQPLIVSNATYTASNSTLTGWTKTVSKGYFLRAAAPGMTGGPCTVSLTGSRSN